MFIPTNYLLQQLLANGETTVTSGNFAGILSAAKVGLVAANMTPVSTNVYSDVTQPTYVGYAEQAAVFGAVYRRKEGGFAVLSAQLRFHEASTISAQTIYGAYLTDGQTTPNLLGIEIFTDSPKSLQDALDSIFAEMQVALGGPDFGVGNYSD